MSTKYLYVTVTYRNGLVTRVCYYADMIEELLESLRFAFEELKDNPAILAQWVEGEWDSSLSWKHLTH